MNKPEYSSSLKKTPFDYLISKKIGSMIGDGLLYKDIYHKCFDENLVGIESEQRRREVTNVVYERIHQLDEQLLSYFLNDSLSTSKFVLVYAIAKTDRLFSEFLLSVYREAILGDKHYISISDFQDFFASIKQKNLFVAKWTDTTIRDLATGYRNVLVESGLCSRVKKTMVPNGIIVNPSAVQHIEEIGDKVYLQAILGVK